MRRLLRRLRRDERGFTLIELLVSMPIGLIVIFVAMDVLTNTWSVNSEVAARQDALQRGRATMEIMTRQLRSSVCLTVVTPARSINDGSDNSITFFADLGDGSSPPQRRNLSYDPVTHRIMETDTNGVGSPPTFAATPTKTLILMDNAAPSAGIPIFRYYSYNGATISTTALTTPLSVADAARTTDVSVTFVATAKSLTSGNSGLGETFTNDVFSRTVDPMNAKAGQSCA